MSIGEKIDLHKIKAAELFKVPVSEVTPEQRKFAKQQSFVEAYSFRQSLGQFLKEKTK